VSFETTPALPDLPFRPAVPAGDWLAVSGQIGVLDEELVEGGAEAQTRQALANLEQVLIAQGSSLAAVVKVNVFLTSMSDYDAMNRAYAETFSAAPPARSAVAVSGLPLGALVEIEAWAFGGS
jgi:2-iminobutanoate/2-iminopropanoate deaminase